jgi:hypothetical protein
VQAAHRRGRVGPERVAQRQQAEEGSIPSDADDREPLALQLADALAMGRDGKAFGREEVRAADGQLGTVEPRPNPPARDGLESL